MRLLILAGHGATLEWINEAFLEKHGVAPWKDLPLWVPEAHAEASGFLDVPLRRALANGLALRRLEETIADTLAWNETRAANREWKAGLAADRERALLAAWDAARGGAPTVQSR